MSGDTTEMSLHEGYFGTDHKNLNRGQMTTMTSEPASPNFHIKPAGRYLTHKIFSLHRDRIRDGSSLESGPKPSAIRSRRQDSTTSPADTSTTQIHSEA
ncbi:hypothetical protein AVEN_118011-1 [Araneus ventricosus]|uniref:Uncharacterized protein n=1 Tax=Araneus ventricosus TaxID=182803 RepID=A0A4Y2C927_ARAVE|nr:hypothetical protein AVEN_118011-1 [Araneus ventricosus]